MSDMQRVCVVGLGYIGLPTAVAFATAGLEVVGVDVRPEIVTTISEGRAPFAEPDLAIAVSGAVAVGRLKTNATPVSADAFIIAVPTPFDEQKKANLRHVREAVEAIAPVLSAGSLIVLESTSPPGTCEKISRWCEELRPDLTFPHTAGAHAQVNVAYCPERVLPGRIMIEIITNDRIVGGLSRLCSERAAALYKQFCQGTCHVTDAATAELVKLSENAYRDVNIAFANELANVSDDLGIDVYKVISLANRHPRVQILDPGPGVGGHCIAVDPWFIISAVPGRTLLLRAARQVNDDRPSYVLNEVLKTAARFREPVIACLGLTFKANVDDVRESPAMSIVEALASSGAGPLLVVEPHLDKLPQAARLENVLKMDLNDALGKADIVVALVAHDEFKSVQRPVLRGKVIFDTCGVWR